MVFSGFFDFELEVHMADRVKNPSPRRERDLQMDLDLPRPYPRVQKDFHLPSRTRQSETASTDLGKLVQRYKLAGGLPPSTLTYGDVSDFPADRLEALQRVASAKEAFDALPLLVRNACGFDPRRLEEWVVGNPDLAREAGLLKPRDPEPSSPAKPASSADAGEGQE